MAEEESSAPSVRHPLDPWRLDRQRGILTQADREYLCGESELTPESHGERRARERIRNRIRHGLLDFSIILQHLEDRDRGQIFTDKKSVVQHVANVRPDVIGFIYQYSGDDRIQRDVEAGVRNALVREGWFSEIEANIDINRIYRVEDAVDEIHNRDIEDLSSSHLRQLLFADVIDNERFAELIQKRTGDKE